MFLAFVPLGKYASKLDNIKWRIGLTWESKKRIWILRVYLYLA